MSNATDNKDIRYIESEMNTLQDIVQIPELSGNYCLVDLWATWCVPCRKEFSYSKELYGVLSEYGNIKQVYISIDDISNKQQWQELIERYNLQGSHFIANTELRRAIIKQIYGNRAITIPRYILLSLSGEVLCSDFPHPHELQKIAAALKGYIKK